MTDPDTFERRWKNHVYELNRLQLASSGEDFERIGEIQDELDGIIETIAEEQR